MRRLNKGRARRVEKMKNHSIICVTLLSLGLALGGCQTVGIPSSVDSEREPQSPAQDVDRQSVRESMAALEHELAQGGTAETQTPGSRRSRLETETPATSAGLCLRGGRPPWAERWAH